MAKQAKGMKPAPGKRIVIGITGASGAIYAKAFIETCPGEKFLIPTRWGKEVFESEMKQSISSLAKHVKALYDDENMFSPFASGSVGFDALVILPCTVSTMAKIAHGISDNLLTRVAQVALKERRTLILGLREAPLSSIALRNAASLSDAGAVIFPLCPSFYLQPENLGDLVRTLTGRIQAFLGYPPEKSFMQEELE